jgi:hydrogenase maturation protein HypF
MKLPAAIELEMRRDESAAGQPYPLAINEASGILQIDPGPLFCAIVQDFDRGTNPGAVSQRFHDGLTQVFSRIALILREHTSLNSVCLSWGIPEHLFGHTTQAVAAR